MTSKKRKEGMAEALQSLKEMVNTITGELPSNFSELSKKEQQQAINKANKERQMLMGDREPEKKRTTAKQFKEDTIETSYFNNDKILVEQIYREGKARFCVYYKETQEIKEVERFAIDGYLYQPINGDEVIRGFVGLPSKPEPYGTTKELLLEIQYFINKWVDLQNPLTKTLTPYNILKSWVFQRFHTLNYNRFLGEHGTGKSRALDVIGSLHYKPISTSGALTSAVLFRIINKWGGTIIVDEADQTKSDASQDIIKILNQGYEANRPVLRCDPNDHNVQFFDTFCPKVIATRNEFDDKALESRCITEVMVTTTRKDIPPNLNVDFKKEISLLRNKLLQWRFDNFDKINPELGSTIDLGDIEPRLRQVSTGFATMIADDPVELDNFRKYLSQYQDELRSLRANTVEGRIVTGIAELLLIGREYMSAGDIIEVSSLLTDKGARWNSRALTKYMKMLGFGTSHPMRVDGSMGKFYSPNIFSVHTLLKRFSDNPYLIKQFEEKLMRVCLHGNERVDCLFCSQELDGVKK